MSKITERLLNKECKLVLYDGFVLYGKIVDYTDYGIWFETPQKTAFQSFTNIRKIVPRGDTKSGG